MWCLHPSKGETEAGRWLGFLGSPARNRHIDDLAHATPQSRHLLATSRQELHVLCSQQCCPSISLTILTSQPPACRISDLERGPHRAPRLHVPADLDVSLTHVPQTGPRNLSGGFTRGFSVIYMTLTRGQWGVREERDTCPARKIRHTNLGTQCGDKDNRVNVF